MSELDQKDIDRLVRPGDVLAGKYKVERLLGVGGMGVVVAATHAALDQRVAVKLLLPSMMSNREIVERFQREARAAAKIKSEHVVRVSDVGTLESGAPFIVMELLDGRDLGAMLARRGPLPVQLAVDYILEACEALAEAHSAGIVHRDLKPANLFLAKRPDETDVIKVLDFGISKQLAHESALQASPSLTKTTDVFGSPTYMSPEQLKASRDVDARADVWALGVILFELVAGTPPFGGGTVAEIFGAILHQPAPRLRDVRKDAPADLERVLARCFEKEPSKRFQTVAELAEALSPLGSAAARESSARVSRILRAGAVSRRSGAGPLPSGTDATEISLGSIQASTSLNPRAVENAGSATSTTWSDVKPTGRSTSSARTAMIAAAVLIAAAGGAFVSLQIFAGGAKPTTSGAASQVPSGEVPTSVPQPPTAVVIPAPTESATAATTAAPTASATAKPSSQAGSRPPTNGTASTSKPGTGGAKPPSGDDDFGGRK